MTKKLWGGRFSKKTDPLVEEFTKSIYYDYKLSEYDLLGSMIHVEILRNAGYLKAGEAARLYKGLKSIYEDVKNGEFKPDERSEDIHTDIQNKLEARVGSVASKLHTARSRNEQVAFSTRLYCKFSILELQVGAANFVSSLGKLIHKYEDMIIPGYTHMQHAQAVYLRDYLFAYVEMLKRDNARLNYIFKAIKLTMGAGALAGTPIKRDYYNVKVSKFLKGLEESIEFFDVQAADNSIDSVSDRDFVIEILSALSILSMHLSRFAEDLIIWSTKEFGFVDIGDSFTTGSSLMPQKKNPDVLELVRGNAGRVYGNLVSLLTTMKGVPLSYDRDMQLDKEPLFYSIELVLSELKVLSGLVGTLKFNKDRIKEELKDESLYAADLVYYLVGKGMPFAKAHETVGKLVRYSTDYSIQIKDMTQSQMDKFSEKFVKNEILKLFDPEVSVKSKKSIRR
ncbi:MAG: argininosuccinate lyase [Omnitrophica bacterium RIFCSPLOWO2_01_FULL_45_10]|nr:MAG: argininosuccinate lyase [Omnitrophica bacterium RIFCSPLOWO2_01_FULL_45_10]